MTGISPDDYNAVVDQRDYFIEHEKAARERCQRLERELRATYDELNKALGGNAPRAWDRIMAAVNGD